MTTEWHRLIAQATGDVELLDLDAKAEAFPAYVTEYLSALDRTERLGLKGPPRVMVKKDCLDIVKLMPLMLRYFSWYQGKLMGRTLTIHTDVQQVILDAFGIPCTLSTGWMERDGRPIFKHDDDVFPRFLRDKKAAYASEGLPFHIWLTSPAFEVQT